MFEVYVSHTARTDLQDIVDWWKENRSADQAQRWYASVLVAIESLSHMPQRCLIIRNSDVLGRQVHQLLFGVSGKSTHRIFFSIDGNRVTILRVLHTSQEQPTKAGEL